MPIHDLSLWLKKIDCILLIPLNIFVSGDKRGCHFVTLKREAQGWADHNGVILVQCQSDPEPNSNTTSRYSFEQYNCQFVLVRFR